ncbi:PREDICTED: uncharacterized protein LOC108376146 [Rhagoletis zephyria]|uniref:uncharacterized protein LOC108376146 n=1 Tax=Rhagoletis zephyria TaxID=28612 RepID=UPI0008117106|nr:PREDICTED: uncharacterized protein LOC108376146 [Rhagoletis zephyria]
MDRFLSNRFQTLESVSGLRGITAMKPSKAPNYKHTSELSHKRLGAFQTSVVKYMCNMCQCNEHKVHLCPRFRKLTVEDRVAFEKNNNCCVKCLAFRHLVSKCTSSFNCATCHSRNHSLLHVQTAPPKETNWNEISEPLDTSASTSGQAQMRRESTIGKSKTVNKLLNAGKLNKILAGELREQ